MLYYYRNFFPYQIAESLVSSLESPATISNVQKNPIPMNIFKYSITL